MKTTWSHNTVTVDGRDQGSRTARPRRRLERLVEADRYAYLSSEAAAALPELGASAARSSTRVRIGFVLADTVTGAQGR